MRLFLHELRNQQVVFWRSREAALFIFLFPLLLFLLLGSVYNGKIYGVPAPEAPLRRADIPWLAPVVFFGGFAGPLLLMLGLNLPAASTGSLLLTGGTPARLPARFVLGRILYGTPFPHALGSLVLAIILGAAAFAALGVATASLIRSAEGSSAVVNFILLPMAFLTGSFGPTRHYPAFLRAIGDILPLKYFIDIMNAVYLHGHALWTKGAAIGVLAAWGVTGLALSALKFRWEPREG